jgi:hypothetical protein
MGGSGVPPRLSAGVSYQPAPDSVKGIEFYYVVGDEFFFAKKTITPTNVYESTHYWVVPQIRKETNEIVAYVAFNPELRRNELVIGPNELSFFFEHELGFFWLAAATYPIVGEPRPYGVEHGRMVSSVFRGSPEGMAEHFGASWGYALNPVWYVRSLGVEKKIVVEGNGQAVAVTPGD